MLWAWAHTILISSGYCISIPLSFIAWFQSTPIKVLVLRSDKIAESFLCSHSSIFPAIGQVEGKWCKSTLTGIRSRNRPIQQKCLPPLSMPSAGRQPTALRRILPMFHRVCGLMTASRMVRLSHAGLRLCALQCMFFLATQGSQIRGPWILVGGCFPATASLPAERTSTDLMQCGCVLSVCTSGSSLSISPRKNQVALKLGP